MTFTWADFCLTVIAVFVILIFFAILGDWGPI